MPIQEVLVAGNRGPCGGVNMALEAADQVLDIVNGREPIYSNWDLVNNKPITAELNARGLVSIRNNWDLVPPRSIVVFSAHGVPPSFHQIARDRGHLVIDVTCQLVTRQHNLVINAEKAGKHVVYVGVQGHPETEGVLGEVQPENISLIQKAPEVETLTLLAEKPAVVYSQTTLGTHEIKEVYQALKSRFPEIEIPNRWDICYATDNRQIAVEQLVKAVDALVVVGSKHSHNSQELRKKGDLAGIPSYSVDVPSELQPEWFTEKMRILGITSGASVLDRFMRPVAEWFKSLNPDVQIRELDQVKTEKQMTFGLPKAQIEALRTRYAT